MFRDKYTQSLHHNFNLAYVHTYFGIFHYTQNIISISSFSPLFNRFGVTCPHVEEDGH